MDPLKVIGKCLRRGIPLAFSLLLLILTFSNLSFAGTWEIQTVGYAGDQLYEQYTSLALDGQIGTPHISYHDTTTDYYLKYASQWGGCWHINTLDPTYSVGRYNSLVLDSDNRPHISYYSDTGSYLKYASGAGGCLNIETVDPEYNEGHYCSLALDSNGNPHISYYDKANGHLRYASLVGGTWYIETADSDFRVGYTTSLALDSSDNPHISYYDYTDGHLKYASKTGGAWYIETVDSAGDVGLWSSLALDSNDDPHISYFDYTNKTLKYASKAGSSWSVDTVDIGGELWGESSLALDSNDNPRISGFDWTNRVLKYASWEGSGWNIQSVDTSDEVGGISLALDGNDNPHVSYLANGYYSNMNHVSLKYASWVTEVNSAVTVESPSAQDITLEAGTIYIISWEATAEAGFPASDYIWIYFSWDNGLDWTLATEQEENDPGTNTGTYQWTVPYVVASCYGLVRIEARDSVGNIWLNASDNNFSIIAPSTPDTTPPAVTLEAPSAAGITLDAGTKYVISWEATDDLALPITANYISVYLSTDEGVTWTTIETHEENDPGTNTGTYEWTVPTVSSDSCRISIEATDWIGNKGRCVSDNNFSISVPAVVYVSPAGSDETGTGTIEAPFRTIQKGLNVVAASGEVRLLGGVFNEAGDYSIAWPARDGITLKPSDETCVCTMDAHGSGRLINVPNAVSLTIEGITMKNGMITGAGGGIKLASGCALWLKEVTIKSCTAEGSSPPSDDAGGAVYSYGSNVYAQNCIFSFNRTGTDGYGGVAYGGKWNAVNCLFDSNRAAYGGVAEGWTGSSVSGEWTTTNCSFAYNYAPGNDGGAIGESLVSWTSVNCIFWGNYQELFAYMTPAPTIIYSDVQGGYSGTGNISSDSLFVSTPEANYRLLSTSECIDSGTSEGAPSDDLDGVSRPQGAEYDMGCYEWTAPGAPLITVESPNGGERLPSGVVYKIMWRTNPNADDINIRVSTDEGNTWSLITDEGTYSGVSTYEWTPSTDFISTECLISVEAGYYGLWSCDASDATFEIFADTTSPVVTVEAPNGGELLYSGQETDIGWQASDETGLKSNPVILWYSTNEGGSWVEIASNEANDGTYLWTVPAITSSEYLVSVEAEDTSGNTGADTSDSTFEVQLLSTVYVSPAGSDETGTGTIEAPFRTIQKGLDVVFGSGEVRMMSGIYTIEAGSFVNYSMINWPNKPDLTLKLSPEAAEPVTIDAQSSGRAISVEAAVSLTIEGVTIMNGRVSSADAQNGGGIYLPSNTTLRLKNVSIRNCSAESNSTSSSYGRGGAIYCPDNTAQIFADNCLFFGNKARNRGGVSYYGTWNVTNSIFKSNSAPYQYGGVAYYGAWTAANCAFAYNSAVYGGVGYSGSWTGTNCIFWGNLPGLISRGPVFYNVSPANIRYSDVQSNPNGWGQITPTACISLDAKFLSVTEDTANFLRLGPGSPCIDSGTWEAGIPSADADGNPRPRNWLSDMGVYEFKGPGVKVLVPNGGEIYKPGDSIPITYRVTDEYGFNSSTPVTIRYSVNNGSNWDLVTSETENTGIYTWEAPDIASNQCLISIETTNSSSEGNYDASDNAFNICRTIVFVSPAGSDETGTGTIGAPYKTLQKGLDLVTPSGEVRVMSGTYYEWLTWPNKDNITLKASDETQICTLDGDDSGPIIDVTNNVKLSIENFTLMNGRSDASIGGAIRMDYVDGAYLSLYKVNFINNTAGSPGNTYHGGAIALYPNGVSTIEARDCSFINNFAYGSGGAIMGHEYSVIIANNCTFYGNTCEGEGGALSGLGYSDLDWRFYNCTFMNNRGGAGGGDAVDSTVFNGTNCIFWGSDDQFRDPSGTLKYCDVQNSDWSGFGAINCISSNPLIASTDEADPDFLRPGSGSPCIDAGTFETGVPTEDAAGNSVPRGLMADIGAYEFQGPSVRVIQPNGGEAATPETTYNIIWQTSAESTLNVKVRLSTNGGTSWGTLITNESWPHPAGVSTYEWTVPDIASTSCLISIEVSGESSGIWNCDASNGTFVIGNSPPLVTVESPNGGESIKGGDIFNIRWKAIDDFTPNDSLTVRLYYTSGESWIAIAATKESSTGVGTYEWNTPSNFSSTEVKVRITATDDANNIGTDESNAKFTIDSITPEVALISPEAGTTLEGGTSYTIKWTASDDVSLESFALWYTTNEGSSWTQIAGGLTGAATTCGWSVPSTDATACYVSVEAKDTVDHSKFAISGKFNIMTKPNAINNLAATSLGTKEIMLTWEAPSDNVPAQNVVSYEGYLSTEAITAGNFGNLPQNKFTIGIPEAPGLTEVATISGLAANKTYYFAIRSRDNFWNWSAISNVVSAETRDIYPPIVTVEAPNGGETIKGGDKYNIVWRAIDNVTPNLSLTVRLYYTSGESWIAIAATKESSTGVGTYEWNTPSNFSSTEVKVRATATDETNNIGTDESNAKFTIDSFAPTISVTSPDAGLTIEAASSFNIKWIATDEIQLSPEAFTIWYATSEGANWIKITGEVSSSLTTYSWTVPDAATTEARVSMEAKDKVGHTRCAVSGKFEVKKPFAPGIYVSTSGSDTLGDGTPSKPYATIAKSLSIAGTGETVFVSGGTYPEYNIRWPNRNNVTLKAYALASPVTIDAGGVLTRRCITVESVSLVTNLTIEGITLQGGRVSNVNGGGLYLNKSGINVWLKNVTIQGCSLEATSNPPTYLYGGAVYCIDNTVKIFAQNCLFRNNISARFGGMAFQGAWYVTDSAFNNNITSLYDGGVATAGNWTVTGCAFSNNTAARCGGVADNSVSGGGAGTSIWNVTRCTFEANRALNGDGGVDWGVSAGTSTWFVKESTFKNNICKNWGGVARLANFNVKDCTFINNTSSLEGGVAFQGTWTATNCAFISNRANGGGVGQWTPMTAFDCIFVSNEAIAGTGGVNKSASWTVTRCTFEANKASTDGGVDWGSTWKITNSTFKNNSAANYGGVARESTWYVASSEFNNNSVTNNDGGVAYLGTWTATKCAFSNNRATGTGGVAYGGTWTANNCNFISNEVINYGGVTYLANMTATDCNFKNNKSLSTSGYTGGGVAAGTDATHPTWNVTRCTFEGNSSARYGGVAWRNHFNARDCIFINNTSTMDGGVVCEVPPSTTTWITTNCAFIGNRTSGSNGGVSANTYMKAFDCIFVSNEAGINGGVSSDYDRSWIVTRCTFEANRALSATGGGGVNNTGYWYVTDSTFKNNSAFSGGVAKDSTWTATGCAFSNNRASSDAGVAYNSPCTVSGCTFEGNSAGRYGGVARLGKWNVRDSVFRNNIASDNISASGQGGVVFDVSAANTWTVTNCAFERNRAYMSGGVCNTAYMKAINCIFISNEAVDPLSTGGVAYSSTLEAINCVFNKNRAGLRGGVANSSTWNAVNSIFWANSAPTGPVFYNTPAGGTMKYCNMQSNGWGSLTPTKCISVEPKFVSTTEGAEDFHLKSSSPCIDTGTLEGAPNYDKNNFGRPLPSGGKYDIGAYEYGGGISPAPPVIRISGKTTQYYSINAALNDAAAGDTVILASGKYTDVSINWPATNNIILSGEGGGLVTLEGSGNDPIIITTNVNATIEGIMFTGGGGTQGGAIQVNGGSVDVIGCTFTNNSAGSGGAGSVASSMRLINCVFNGNSSTGNGGALKGINSNISVINSTFYGNTSGGQGGAVYIDATSTLNVLNSILWNNAPDQIAGTGTKNVTYSDIQGGWTGTGNISSEPRFVSTAEGAENLRLTGTSPCIDTALSAGAPDYDIEKTPRPRPAGGKKDMGAYEYGGGTNPPATIINETTGAAYYNLNVALNDASSNTTISLPAGDFSGVAIIWPAINGLTLEGQGSNETIITGVGTAPIVSIGAVTAAITGIGFVGGGTQYAAVVVSGGGVTVNNCKFTNCEAYIGSIVIWVNVLWVNGGTIHGSPDANISVTNSTIYGNTGGGISIDAGAKLKVINSILWGNTPGQITGEGSSITNNVTVEYSDIEGGRPGTGNISEEPQFINAGADDFHLQAASPCIDTATTEGAPAADLDGAGRPQGLGIDMGCYEWSDYPTIEVRINDDIFLNKDLLPPSKANNEVDIKVASTANVSIAEMFVDGAPVALIPSPPHWTGSFASPPVGTHHLTFYASNEARKSTIITLEAQVRGGGVQMVGTPLNYPNPFKPLSGQATKIQYTLTADAPVTIYIYDITGHEVKRFTFSSGENGGRASVNTVQWDGKSLTGQIAGNAMYIYKIITRDKVLGTGKLVILD